MLEVSSDSYGSVGVSRSRDVEDWLKKLNHGKLSDAFIYITYILGDGDGRDN